MRIGSDASFVAFGASHATCIIFITTTSSTRVVFQISFVINALFLIINIYTLHSLSLHFPSIIYTWNIFSFAFSLPSILSNSCSHSLFSPLSLHHSLFYNSLFNSRYSLTITYIHHLVLSIPNFNPIMFLNFLTLIHFVLAIF
jgi:hypothetical protein